MHRDPNPSSRDESIVSARCKVFQYSRNENGP